MSAANCAAVARSRAKQPTYNYAAGSGLIPRTTEEKD